MRNMVRLVVTLCMASIVKATSDTANLNYISEVRCLTLKFWDMATYCSNEIPTILSLTPSELNKVYVGYGLEPQQWSSNSNATRRRLNDYCRYYKYPECLRFTNGRTTAPAASPGVNVSGFLNNFNNNNNNILVSVNGTINQLVSALVDIYSKLNVTVTGQQVSPDTAITSTDDDSSGTTPSSSDKNTSKVSGRTRYLQWETDEDDSLGDDTVGLLPAQTKPTSTSQDISVALAKSLEDTAYNVYQYVATMNTTSPKCGNILKEVVCDAASEPDSIDFSVSISGCTTSFCRADFEGKKDGSWVGDIGCGIKVRGKERVPNVTGGVFGGKKKNHPMILNTSKPGKVNKDLGSPHKACTPAGPGVGAGGKPNITGSNCNPLGNVLIVSQDGNQTEPHVNPQGGILTFKFDEAVRVEAVGLLNHRARHGSITLVGTDGSLTTFKPTQLGPNSMQVVRLGVNDVVKMKVKLFKRAAVAFVDVIHSTCGF